MKKLIPYCLLSLSISLSSAQLADEVITLADGKYEIALDEVQQHPADGGVAQPMRLRRQSSAKALVGLANESAAATGERCDLVLYRKGEKRSEKTRRVLTRKILVKIKEGTSAKKVAQAAGAQNFSEPEYAPGYVILEFAGMGDSLKMLPKTKSLAGVLSAEPLTGRKRFKRFTPNDPRYAYSASNPRYQWYLKNTGANGGTVGEDANIESTWDDVKGAGITIAIIDDGLEVAHPDLAANVNTAIDHDWNDNTPDDPTPTDPQDDHGTSCAGVTAGVGNNGIGISGAAPDATLVGLRLIAGSPSDSDEAEAMNWRNDVIQVKNNSWGPGDGGGTLTPAGPLVRAAYASSAVSGRGGLGTIHMWAAGNGGSNDDVNQDGYANSIYTVAIGAVTDTGARADYSEPGCAKVVSTYSDGGSQAITTTTLVQNGSYTDNFGGTSSATPLASGIVALMLEKNPNLGWRDVQEVLIKSARKTQPNDSGWIKNGGDLHFHHDFGAGIIDTAAAVNLSNTWTNLPAQDSFNSTRSGLAQAIPDNSTTGTTVEFDLSAETDLRVEHVTLELNLTHPTRGQLRISLISPSGTESFLSVPHNFSGPDYDDWKMMTVFNWGEASPGIWTLKVVDETSGQTGTINSATIEVFGSVAAAPTDPPAFTHNANTSGNIGSPFSYLVRATNSATQYTAQGLPPGLTISAENGTISGTPTSQGTFNVTLTATNVVGTTNGAVTIAVGAAIPTPPVITSQTSATAIIGQYFSYQISASNSPASFTATPLPSGVTLSPTGLLSGMATTAGDYQVTIAATNADGTGTATLNLIVVEVGVGPLAAALDNDDLFFFSEGMPEWTSQGATFIFDNDALQSPLINDFESTSFSTEVMGPGLMEFQWKVSSEEGYDELQVSIDGVKVSSVSGDVDWMKGYALVPAGLHMVSWSYVKDSTESAGQDRGWVDQVSYLEGDFISSLGEALDYPGFAWVPDGNWLGQPITTNDGVDALQSPDIDDSDDASLELEVTGPGVLEFYYRCDTEEDYDFFTFTVDGVEEFKESGLVEWKKHTLTIPAGDHSLKWHYEKDNELSEGADAVWLDQMLWTSSSLSGFEQWTNLNFSPSEQADPEFGGEDGDPDGDGRTNLLEYAFNTSPYEAGYEDEAIFELVGNTGEFTYVADLSKSDIIYEVEESIDLKNWAPLADSVVSTVGDAQTRSAVFTLSEDRVFLRVVVDYAP